MKKCIFSYIKEDVLELLRECPEFSDYSMEQLKTGLEALVGWKKSYPYPRPEKSLYDCGI